MSVGIRLVGASLTSDSLLVVLLEKAVDVLPSVMFMVGWQRAVLLGPNRVGRLPGTAWSGREWAYLMHLIKVAGIPFLLIVAFIFTVGSLEPGSLNPSGPVDPDAMRPQALAAPPALGLLVSPLRRPRAGYGPA